MDELIRTYIDLADHQGADPAAFLMRLSHEQWVSFSSQIMAVLDAEERAAGPKVADLSQGEKPIPFPVNESNLSVLQRHDALEKLRDAVRAERTRRGY